MAHIDYEAADAYAPEDVLGFIEEDLGNISDPLKKLPKLTELYQQLADCLEVKDLREHAEAMREWAVELTEVRDLLKKIKALLPKMQREFDTLMASEIKGKLVAELEALPTVTPLCELGKRLETIVLKMKDEATPDPASDVIGNYIYSDCGVYAKFEKLELSFEASDLSGDIMVAGLLAGYLHDLREAFDDEDEES